MKKRFFVVLFPSLSILLLMFFKTSTFYSNTLKGHSESEKMANKTELGHTNIDNPTIKAFVDYFKRSGDDLNNFGMFEELSDSKRIIVINDNKDMPERAPVIGYSGNDSEGAVGGVMTEEGERNFDTSNHNQSATIAEIKEAVAKSR